MQGSLLMAFTHFDVLHGWVLHASSAVVGLDGPTMPSALDDLVSFALTLALKTRAFFLNRGLAWEQPNVNR